MAGKDLDQKPSPLTHRNARGEICKGELKFAKARSFAELSIRACDWCGRHEAYDLNRIILVAKENIPEANLKEFCAILVQRLETDRLGKIMPINFSPIMIETDKTNPRRLAATITAKNVGAESEPEKFLRAASDKMRERSSPRPPAFDEIIECVWRKPVACDRDGTVMSYV